MSNDFHKRIAKDSLWGMDGYHVKHKYRQTGSAREADKVLVRAELEEFRKKAELDHDEEMNDEIELAIYCHRYGPCRQCKEKG